MKEVKEKILIVDDDEAILEALSMALESEGYIVCKRNSGDNLLPFIKKENPKLVFIDYLLSGKNGKDLIEAIRADSVTATLPVVLISAHPSARRVAKVAGATDFLSKPFGVDDLIKKIKKNLK